MRRYIGILTRRFFQLLFTFLDHFDYGENMTAEQKNKQKNQLFYDECFITAMRFFFCLPTLKSDNQGKPMFLTIACMYFIFLNKLYNFLV
jgi:hypothetical protein